MFPPVSSELSRFLFYDFFLVFFIFRSKLKTNALANQMPLETQQFILDFHENFIKYYINCVVM